MPICFLRGKSRFGVLPAGLDAMMANHDPVLVNGAVNSLDRCHRRMANAEGK
jgi:hypothetical protein